MTDFPSLPTRSRDAHKGSCGNVLVLAGSKGMSGAAYLASKACLRSGAGLVTVACPESVSTVLEIKTTCVMTRALPETPDGTLATAALEVLRGLVPGRDALAIGPGLSGHPQTASVVRSFLAELDADAPPVVLDADGLNAFAGHPELLRPLAGNVVLTPHPGEFRRLSGCSKADLAERGDDMLAELVDRTGAVILLKGHRTRIAGPGGALSVNDTGNPGMATAGAGDVLTGVIACLLAQGLSPFDAARLGARLHGLAGDAAARQTGWAALIATDILNGLVDVMRAEEARI
jgi:NAD(P)H-hydrate epimerase